MLQKAGELEVTEFLGRDHYQRSGDGAHAFLNRRDGFDVLVIQG